MRGPHGELAESGSPPQSIRLIGHDCHVPYHKPGAGGARSTPHHVGRGRGEGAGDRGEGGRGDGGAGERGHGRGRYSGGEWGR